MGPPKETNEPANKAAEAGRSAASRTAEAGRRATDEATRTARSTIDAATESSLHTADAVADITRSGTEAMQLAAQSSLQMASQVTERSLSQFARVFGFPGQEADETSQQATRNMQAVVDCGTVLAHGFQDISREWMSQAQGRLQRNMDSFGALMRARSPQDAIVIQSEMARDNLESMIESSRRVSQLMMTVADQAMGKIAGEAKETARQGGARR